MPSLSRVSTWQLTLALLLAAILSPRLQAEELAWRLQQGDRYHFTSTQTVEQKTEVLIKSLEVASEITLELDWEVVEVAPNGDATIRQTFRRVALRMTEGPETKIDYDSSDEQRRTGKAKQLDEAIRPVIDAQMTLTLSPQGEIREVAIDEATLQAIREVPGSMRLRTLVTPAAVKEMLTPMTLLLPAGDIQPGHAWEQKRPAATPGIQLAVEHQLSYQGPDTERGESLHKIDLVTSFSKPTDEQPEAKVEIDSFTSSGNLWYDAQQGIVSASEQSQTLVTKSQLRELTLTSTSTSRSVCSLKKVEE